MSTTFEQLVRQDVAARIPHVSAGPAPYVAPDRPARRDAREAGVPSRAGFRYVSQVLLTSLPLVAADFSAVAASVGLAAMLTSPFAPAAAAEVFSLTVPLGVAILVANFLFSLYPAIGQTPTFELRQSTIATLLIYSVVLAEEVLRGASSQAELAALSIAGLLTLALVPLLRSLARSFFCRFQFWGHPVLIFSAANEGRAVYDYLQSHRRQGLRPIGILDAVERQWRDDLTESPEFLDVPSSVHEQIARHGVFWGVIAMPRCSQEEIVEVMDKYAACIPHLVVMQEISELPCLWNRAHESVGLPGIRIKERMLLPLPLLAKRAIDLSIVLLGGILILPLIAAICLVIKSTSSGPVLYRQLRVGQGRRRFWAWKFRTMFADADKYLDIYLDAHPELREEWERDHKLRHDPRVTRVGNFLRKTSLDELPQIWNVLRGEMSLVGPRPIVDEEIEKYGDKFVLYSKVLPGITGLWQVSGRNNTSYPERVALDVHYVRNWSPWLDVYILLRTIKVVLKREGAF